MGAVRPSKKGAQKRPPSAADQADAQALDKAVQTMIEGPLSEWNHTRPLASLNRDDLRKLATAAIIGWVLKRAELSCQEETDLNSDVLFAG